MKKLPKSLRVTLCLSFLAGVLLFYWWLEGQPALTPARPLAQTQRMSLLEPGTYVARLPASSVSSEEIFLTRKEAYLRFVPLVHSGGLWYPSPWNPVTVVPLAGDMTLSVVPFYLDLTTEGGSHMGPAVFLYQPHDPAKSCQVTVTVGERCYELAAAAGENGLFFLPMTQMNQPENRADRQQILSVMTALSHRRPAENTLPIRLDARLLDESGTLLTTCRAQFPAS